VEELQGGSGTDQEAVWQAGGVVAGAGGLLIGASGPTGRYLAASKHLQLGRTDDRRPADTKFGVGLMASMGPDNGLGI